MHFNNKLILDRVSFDSKNKMGVCSSDRRFYAQREPPGAYDWTL